MSQAGCSRIAKATAARRSFSEGGLLIFYGCPKEAISSSIPVDDQLPDSHIPADEVIERIAAIVVERRLAAPAIFMLEMQKPLCGIYGAAGEASRPLIGAFLGPRLAAQLVRVAGSHEQIEKLIRAIEQGDAARKESRA